MHPAFIDFLVLGGTATLSALGGWLASRRFEAGKQRHGDAGKVRDGLARLNRLAEWVVADVRAHKCSVMQLSEELGQLGVEESPGLAECIRRLVETNQALDKPWNNA